MVEREWWRKPEMWREVGRCRDQVEIEAYRNIYHEAGGTGDVVIDNRWYVWARDEAIKIDPKEFEWDIVEVPLSRVNQHTMPLRELHKLQAVRAGRRERKYAESA